MSSEAVRELVARLGASSSALVAVGTALRARAGEIRPNAGVQRRVDEVLDALGLREDVARLRPSELAPILAVIRSDLLIGAKLVSRDSSGTGWSHDEKDLLQSFGDVSAGFPELLKTRIGPQLGGLPERLAAPDASFLDVGVGVAALSIGMVRQWPSLRVVGVDPWAPSLEIARRNVQAVGLSGQIDLRDGSVERLADTETFDLGWIPSLFIAEQSLPSIVRRVGKALRPGGWLLVAMINAAPDQLATAIMRFRTAVWGGSLLPWEDVRGLMVEAGLADVRLLPGPVASPVAMAVARRA